MKDRVPVVRVRRDRRGLWGVQVKWPRTGPWTRHMLFPRFAWHGPFGNPRARWEKRSSAEIFAGVLLDGIAAALRAQAARKDESTPGTPQGR